MNWPEEFINKIICGDCLEVIKELPDKSIDLVLTDPPYGDNCGYGRGGVEISNNQNPLFSLMMLSVVYEKLKNNSVVYMFFGKNHFEITKMYIEKYTEYKWIDWVVWDKKHFGMGKPFRKQFELLAVLEKGDGLFKRMDLGDVLTEKRLDTEDHPHKKPTGLLQALIENSSEENNIILDCFAGSGSSLVAAQNTKRNFIGIEIDPKYCEIAKQRLRQQTLL